jgi:hypothetical protein
VEPKKIKEINQGGNAELKRDGHPVEFSPEKSHLEVEYRRTNQQILGRMAS